MFRSRVKRSAEEVRREAHKRGEHCPDHHWTFDYFPPWPWPEKVGRQTGVLGETFPVEFIVGAQTFDRIIPAYYPPIDSEYYELTDLLEAVLDADHTFTFIEAGAGFGRWSARAVLACRRAGVLSPRITMIEGDPVHARWAREMMALSGIDCFRLIEGAVAAQRGKSLFLIDVPTGFFGSIERTNPAEWYGQSLASAIGMNLADFAQREETYEGRPVFSGAGWRAIEIDVVTLEDVIANHEHVDLIDMDIQGAEGEVIASSLDLLTRRVRRLCVETHTVDIERNLRRLLGEAGWLLLRDLPVYMTTETPFGPVSMPSGGLQSWINPRRY